MAKLPTFAERVRDEVNCEIQTLKKKLEEERAEREAKRVVERVEREAERATEQVKRKEERTVDRAKSDARLEALREEFMAIFANQSQVYKLVKFMQMSCLLVISSVGSSMA
jgi:flagellar biosynthesis GTPase FlhF